jgi:hypothetical protein
MKSKLFALALVMALAFALNANAQIKAQANVPFSFTVGEKALPAGGYEIKDAGMNAVLIQSAHGSAAALVTVSATQKSSDQGHKLVFHKYDDRYFLYQVWSGGSRGMELRETKYEK